MSIYKQASKVNLRFTTDRGILTTDDLWHLPLQKLSGVTLDSLWIELSQEMKAHAADSLIEPKRTDKLLQLKLDILKDIITDKIAEQDAKQQAKLTAQRKSKLQLLIANKKDSALQDMSLEDLEKMEAEL